MVFQNRPCRRRTAGIYDATKDRWFAISIFGGVYYLFGDQVDDITTTRPVEGWLDKPRDHASAMYSNARNNLELEAKARYLLATSDTQIDPVQPYPLDHERNNFPECKKLMTPA